MNANTRTQLARFLRLFVVAFVAQAAGLDLSHLGRSAIIALVLGAAEVAWRQLRPAVPAPLVKWRARR